MKNVLTLFVLLGFCTEALAQKRENLLITKLNVVTSESTTSNVYESFTRLYLKPGRWGNTDCRVSAADIGPDDERLYRAALDAHIAGRTIDVIVDPLTRYETDVCKVEAIRVHSK